MSTGSVVVVGSSNMDLVAKAERIPVPGQTLTGTDFFMAPGGKGANQAVAAAKLGADVIFVARLGKDVFAERSLENFHDVGVDTRFVEQLDGVPSGVAIIEIEDSGQNSIIVIPGANGRLSPADVDEARNEIVSAAVVVAQLEVPLETVERAADIAHRHKVPFILDPAPAAPLSDELLGMVDIIKPNETEAETLTGIKVVDVASAERAAAALLGKGIANVIITLGTTGLLLAHQDSRKIIPAVKVEAVDTTAAGDTFTGALAWGLARGFDLEKACIWANTAAAISVTRYGAQPSVPTLDELMEMLPAQGR